MESSSFPESRLSLSSLIKFCYHFKELFIFVPCGNYRTHSLLQHLGLGSVIYIFALSFLLWLIIKPYFVENWSYFSVLAFVSLTSFPAIFYAIPVEMFLDIPTSASINAWFLAIVASWRLALLYFFLRRFTRLEHPYTLVATLLPVCLIIVILTILNLERAVFDIMGGFRESTSKDKAYGILVFLTTLSIIFIIPLLIGYLAAIVNRWKVIRKRKETSITQQEN